jgi:hypothetical protein
LHNLHRDCDCALIFQVEFEESRIILHVVSPTVNRDETLVLAAPIEPDKCTMRIGTAKIELKLKKKERGDWSALEKE